MWTEIIVITIASGISLISHPTDHGFYATQDECETEIFKKFQTGDLEGKKLERTHHDKTQLITPISGGEVVRECVELRGYERISGDTFEKAKADVQRREKLAEEKRRAELEAKRVQEDLKAKSEAEELAVLDALASELAKSNVLDAMTTRISRSWRRPVSFRSGLEVYMQMSLASNGELLDVRIVQSSGDVSFDQSSLSAVKRAAPFYEVKQFDSRTFEEKFRTLTVKFRP